MNIWKRKPTMIVPPWMMWFFLVSHAAMWVVSNAQTFYIIYELKKEFRVFYNRRR